MNHPAMQEEVLRINGIKMNVATAGEGRPALLLHGFPDTHEVWSRQIDSLVAAGYRVIAPDLRGYGKSDAPASVASYAIAILRTDIIALMDALKIDKAYLIGHDWGAILGWQVCMYAPERVECFAALSVGHPNAYANAGVTQKLLAWYALVFQVPGFAEATLRLGNLLALRPYAVDADQLTEWRSNFSGDGRLAVSHAYPPVLAPVMGVWSQGDPALLEGQMKNSADHVAGPFRYEKITGSVGHWLQLTASDRVNHLLIDFGAQR